MAKINFFQGKKQERLRELDEHLVLIKDWPLRQVAAWLKRNYGVSDDQAYDDIQTLVDAKVAERYQDGKGKEQVARVRSLKAQPVKVAGAAS